VVRAPLSSTAAINAGPEAPDGVADEAFGVADEAFGVADEAFGVAACKTDAAPDGEGAITPELPCLVVNPAAKTAISATRTPTSVTVSTIRRRLPEPPAAS
jgi:hypothetical protein